MWPELVQSKLTFVNLLYMALKIAVSLVYDLLAVWGYLLYKKWSVEISNRWPVLAFRSVRSVLIIYSGNTFAIVIGGVVKASWSRESTLLLARFDIRYLRTLIQYQLFPLNVINFTDLPLPIVVVFYKYFFLF